MFIWWCMDFSEGSALEIIERLSSAYGVTTQKALADCLGVPAANVSNWVQRDSVPGSAFIRCSLDTGTNLGWLTSGKLANASLKNPSGDLHGKKLHELVLASGGKAVLRRILDSYGFRTQKELGDLLAISSGTISTWIRREYFPGDVVVTCALDTGVSLQWLATGKGEQSRSESYNVSSTLIPRKNLIAGKLHSDGYWCIDLSVMPYVINTPEFIFSNANSWIIDATIDEVSNGRWLLGIDGKYDVYDVSLVPGRRVEVKNVTSNFNCKVDELQVMGKVALTIQYNL